METYEPSDTSSNLREALESIEDDIINENSLRLSKARTNIKITCILRDLYSKRLVKSSKNSDNDLVFETHLYVNNNNSLQQELITPALSENKTLTNEVSIGKLFGFGIEKELKIPFESFEMTIVGSGKKSTLNTTTFTTKNCTTVNLVFPSQKILVAPFSKVKVTYRVFQNTYIQDYLLDFEPSFASRILVTEPNSRGEDYLKSFFTCRNINYGNFGKKGLNLKLSNEEFIMMNFPATEKFIKYNLSVEVGS